MELFGEIEEEQTTALDVFIEGVSKQHEAALCIAQSTRSMLALSYTLRREGFILCSDWRAAMQELDNGSRVALVAESISREVYDLFSQYNGRSGMVQIFDKESFTFISKQLPVDVSSFVLICTDSAIIDAYAPILLHAGLIFRGESV